MHLTKNIFDGEYSQEQQLVVLEYMKHCSWDRYDLGLPLVTAYFAYNDQAYNNDSNANFLDAVQSCSNWRCLDYHWYNIHQHAKQHMEHAGFHATFWRFISDQQLPQDVITKEMLVYANAKQYNFTYKQHYCALKHVKNDLKWCRIFAYMKFSNLANMSDQVAMHHSMASLLDSKNWTSITGQEKMVKLYMHHKIPFPPNAHYHMWTISTAKVQELLAKENYFDVNFEYRNKKSVLEVALNEISTTRQTILYLIQHGANINAVPVANGPVMRSLLTSDVELLQLCIEHGAKDAQLDATFLQTNLAKCSIEYVKLYMATWKMPVIPLFLYSAVYYDNKILFSYLFETFGTNMSLLPMLGLCKSVAMVEMVCKYMKCNGNEPSLYADPRLQEFESQFETPLFVMIRDCRREVIQYVLNENICSLNGMNCNNERICDAFDMFEVGLLFTEEQLEQVLL